MKRTAKRSPPRRQPKQRRARQTVDAMLDAVARILERQGVAAITTNRIASVAGVSIGSVYQYFPDKRAIYAALHARHADETIRLVESTLVEHATASLVELLRALIEALIVAHAKGPQLYELFAEVPHAESRSFAARLRDTLRVAISDRADELPAPRDLERVLFVVSHMIDALAHAAALHRPPRLSLAAAKEEAVRAVLAYLRS
jgi:AcrR family transcriptional regulator